MATTNKPVKFKYSAVVADDLVGAMNTVPPKTSEFDFNEEWSTISKTKTEEPFVSISLNIYSRDAEGAWKHVQTYPCSDVLQALDKMVIQLNAFDDWHKKGDKTGHRQILLIIQESILYPESPGSCVNILEKFYKDYEKQPVKAKVYINGPHKDKEFLAKVGKHYAHY